MNRTNGLFKFRRILMSKKIIIAGGGSGGLACALFLERAGFSCEVYEQASEFSDVGASFALLPNGVHVLKELGLEEEIKKESFQLKDYLFKDKTGGTVIKLSSYIKDSSVFEDSLYITRHHLISTLYEEVKRKNIPVHFSKRLKNFSQDEKGVTVTFEDNTMEKADLLIGADGTNSQVRSQLFPQQQLKYSGKWAIFGMGTQGELGEAKTFLEQEYISSYFEKNFNLTLSRHHYTEKEMMLV